MKIHPNIEELLRLKIQEFYGYIQQCRNKIGI